MRLLLAEEQGFPCHIGYEYTRIMRTVLKIRGNSDVE